MTLDEAIEKENKIAEENQKIVDTQIVFDDVPISGLYCDDTEVIEEHLSNYRKCEEYHEQLAELLEELKQYKEIGTSEECRAAVEKQKAKKPPVVNRPSIFAKVPVCPNCSTPEHYQPLYGKTKYCSNCGQELNWGDEE